MQINLIIHEKLSLKTIQKQMMHTHTNNNNGSPEEKNGQNVNETVAHTSQ